MEENCFWKTSDHADSEVFLFSLGLWAVAPMSLCLLHRKSQCYAIHPNSIKHVLVDSSCERMLAALPEGLGQGSLCNLANLGSSFSITVHSSVFDSLDASCCSGRAFINVCYSVSPWHCWRMLYCQCSWDKAGTLQFLASHLRRLYFESGLQHWTDAEGRLQWGLSRCARGSFLHWRPLSGVYTVPACQGEVFLLPFAIYNPCSGLLWEENLGDNAKGLPDVFWRSLWPSLQSCIRQKLIVLVTSHEATATQRPKLSLRGTLFNTASAVNVTLNRAVTALP